MVRKLAIVRRDADTSHSGDDTRVTHPNRNHNPFLKYNTTKLQCQMRHRLQLGDSDINKFYYKISFRMKTESSRLTNWYRFVSHGMRLVVGGAMTFNREENHHSWIKDNSTPNTEDTGSARTMPPEADSPIGMASCDQRTMRMIYIPDSNSCDMCTQTSDGKITFRWTPKHTSNRVNMLTWRTSGKRTRGQPGNPPIN